MILLKKDKLLQADLYLINLKVKLKCAAQLMKPFLP